MINARSETAAMKPAFRDPMRFRRCLVPADGFYEWRKTGTSKQPYCFEVNDGQLFDIRGPVGWLARTERAMDQVLLNPDHDTQRMDITGPRSHAGDS
jgi:putative SOS response-associated peptidase YedK